MGGVCITHRLYENITWGITYFVQSFPHQINKPDAPGKPQVSDITDKSAMVTWTPPQSDGGSHISGYFLEKSEVNLDRFVRVSRIAIKETKYQVDELVKGKEYVFRVMAENKVGLGPASEPSDSFVAKLPYGKTV